MGGFSVRVILRRRSAHVSGGDGGDNELQKRMRLQANCAERFPLKLKVTMGLVFGYGFAPEGCPMLEFPQFPIPVAPVRGNDDIFNMSSLSWGQ